MYKFFHSWIIIKPLAIVNLFNYKSQYYGETYFPDLPHKSNFQIFKDQFKHILKYNCFEEYYYLYGLDIKDLRNVDDYLDYPLFMQRRDYLNTHPWKLNYSYIGILRDKFYFSLFMEKWGFPIPKSFGLIKEDKLYLSELQKDVPLEQIVNYDCNLIGKPLDGIGGIGIFLLEIALGKIYYNKKEISLEELKLVLGKKRFFLQDQIMDQHPSIRSLYPKAINTLRITTVRNLHSGEINIMGRMFLMGARDAIVSNWHYGGIIINVDPQGTFDKYGFSLYEKRITKHPETGVFFEGFKVPFFEQALKAAIKCHEMFYGVHSIGWDFAILPEGFVFIEGNDDWGMAAHQMVDKGYVQLFKENYY